MYYTGGLIGYQLVQETVYEYNYTPGDSDPNWTHLYNGILTQNNVIREKSPDADGLLGIIDVNEAMSVGTATTIAFATSSFSAEVKSINGGDITREDVDVTHLGSTGYMEFQPADLVDGGSIEMEIHFDPDDQPPILGVAETITITFPLPSGMSTPATFVFTGYVNAWSWEAPLEEVMTAELTVKVDGKGTAPAWTVAAV